MRGEGGQCLSMLPHSFLSGLLVVNSGRALLLRLLQQVALPFP